MLDPSRIEVPDDAVVEVLRRLTPAERLAVANGMWVSARKALLAMLQADHPQWTEQQVQQEVGRRMLGDDWPSEIHSASSTDGGG